MRPLLASLLVLATAATAAAQDTLAPDVLTVYHTGYVTDYYAGRCGEDVPGTETLLKYCDGADNLGVVTRSTGLAGRGVERILRNHSGDDRQVFRTRQGLSIRNPADDSYYNVPSRAFPAIIGERYDSERRIGDALIAGDGRLVLTGNGIGELGVLDFATGRIARLGLDDNRTPTLLAYDSLRALTYVIARRGFDAFLYWLPDGATQLTGGTELAELPGTQISTFSGVTQAEYRNRRLLLGLNDGLYVYDLTDLDAVRAARYDAADTGALPYDIVRDIAFGPGEGLSPKHDTAWLSLGTRNGSGNALARFDLATGQIVDTFQLNAGNASAPSVLTRFGEIATDGRGLVTANTLNADGIVDLDISSGTPVWTRVTQDSLEALGAPVTYNPAAVAYRDGRFLYGTFDGSSGDNLNVELVIRDLSPDGDRAADAWTTVSDNAPGNFSALATRRFGQARPTPDGGLWWVDDLGDNLVYLDAARGVRIFRNDDTRNLGRQVATDGEGGLYYLSFDSNNDRLRYHDGLQARVVAGSGSESRLLAPFGDEVWTLAPRAGTIDVYADRRLVASGALPDALDVQSYFHMAVDEAGVAWLAQYRGTDLYLVGHDLAAGTTVLDTVPDAGLGNQLRKLLPAPDGSLWLVGTRGARNYADGEASPLYDRDFDPAITTVDDAVVDTVGRLVLGVGFIGGTAVLTPQPDGAPPVVQSLVLAGNQGLLPAVDLYGSSTVTLDADGELWHEGGNGSGFLRVGGLGLAPAYRPGASRPRLTGRVYLDANANGQFDEGEAAGAAGATVAIKRADGGVFTTFIGPDGRYGYLLPTEAQQLEVILTRLPPFTGAETRRQLVDVPAETDGLTAPDFALQYRDYRSLYLQTGNRTGAWGFDRAGFRNAFTGAVTNLSFSQNVFQGVEVEFAYVNADVGAPPLPDVDSVIVTRLTPDGETYVFPYVQIFRKRHDWRVRPGAPPHARTPVAADYEVDRGDDTVRVRLQLARIDPRETYVFEIVTARFDAVGNGNTVEYGYTGTKSDDDDGKGSLADEQGYDGPWLLPPLDGDSGGDEDVTPGGFDPNSPYIDPSDVYEEPPYEDPSDVYSDPPYEVPIFSSYDPNDKLVAGGVAVCEASTEEVECFNATSLDNRELTYTIRFENEGNFSAKDIFVLDTLDASFDARSLQLVEASHDVRIDYLDSAEQRPVVRFAFDDIFLPFQDSINDGYVTFRLRLSAKPTEGLEVTNDAAIYFDQNPPIYTNTIGNRYNAVSGFAEARPPAVALELYPNPATDAVTLLTDGPVEAVRVYDVRGAEVLRGGASAKLLVRGLAAGVYVVRVRTAGGVGTARLVRQ